MVRALLGEVYLAVDVQPLERDVRRGLAEVEVGESDGRAGLGGDPDVSRARRREGQRRVAPAAARRWSSPPGPRRPPPRALRRRLRCRTSRAERSWTLRREERRGCPAPAAASGRGRGGSAYRPFACRSCSSCRAPRRGIRGCVQRVRWRHGRRSPCAALRRRAEDAPPLCGEGPRRSAGYGYGSA